MVRLGPLCVCLLVLARPSPAATNEDGSPAIDFVEHEPWKEQAVQLPPFPERRSLVAVPVTIAGSNLELFIDETTLEVGEDAVVRYVMVLRSPTGTENTFFEGIRCSTQEMRSYAYGAHKGAWQPLDKNWEPIRNLGVGRYRERLYQYYLCRPTVGPLDRKEMLRRMRYGIPRDSE